MESIKVSIITPTYNHENYIEETILSVVNQSHTDWELLIIDDGSTDNTGVICQNWASKDARIKYYRQTNKGLYKLSETYNFALSIASGVYIAVLEGDDYWLPQKLEKQIQLLQKTGSIFSWGMAEARDNNKKILETYPIHFSQHKMDIYNNIKPCSIINMMYEDFPIPLTWVIEKQILDEMGGFVQSTFAPMLDRDTIYNISIKGRFAFVPEIIGIYRKQVEQATSKKMLEITESSGKILENFYNKLPNSLKENIGFTLSDIQRKNKDSMTISYSRFGRILLRQKRFAEARTYYMKSISSSSSIDVWAWKLRSLVGIFFSLLRMDIETFAKVLGKKHYN